MDGTDIGIPSKQWSGLEQRDFSLILLKGKVPFEKGWQRYCTEKRTLSLNNLNDHNVGVACGPASGCLVLDVDDLAAFSATCEKNGWQVPQTFTVETGSGLFHHYFRYPQGKEDFGNKAFKKMGFDIRGKGGQVVAPGSIHPDTGKPYKIVKDLPMAPAPAWVIGLYDKDQPKPKLKRSQKMGAVDIDRLPIKAETKNLIKFGVALGQRSEKMMTVLDALVYSDLSNDEIFSIFDRYPIGEKYRGKGSTKAKWLQTQIDKARSYVSGGSQGERDVPPPGVVELCARAESILAQSEPCGRFNLESLPTTISGYVNEICESTDADPVMVLQSVLCTISAFIGKKAYIEEYFQTLYANIWVVTISGSGTFKTTALNKGAALAFARQNEIEKEIKSLQSNWMGKKLEGEEKKENQRKIESLPREQIILPHRATAEGLLELLSKDHFGMIVCSEFGQWLENLNKAFTGSLKSTLTDFYDVPPFYTYHTRTQGSLHVSLPYITINGVSTLEWIQKHMEGDDVTSGFLPRFLFLYPPQKKKVPPALPTPGRQRDHTFRNELKEILNNIQQDVVYTLDDEAKQLFENIHKGLYKALHDLPDKTQAIIEPFVKRWSPTILKLAMLIQIVIDPKSSVIQPEAIKAAWAVVEYAMKSTMHLFQNQLGESDHQRKCRLVLEGIARRRGSVTRGWLLASKVLDGGASDYDYVFQTLIETGQVTVQESEMKKNWTYRLEATGKVEKVEKS